MIADPTDERVPIDARVCLEMLAAQLRIVKEQILGNDRRLLASAQETQLLPVKPAMLSRNSSMPCLKRFRGCLAIYRSTILCGIRGHLPPAPDYVILRARREVAARTGCSDMVAERVHWRYSAFLSYSHLDVGFARLLQRSLETYRLPRGLRPTSPIADPRSGRLLPVFRDQDDLRAAPDLPAALRAEIEVSRAVIVVCTPNAPRSVWVDKEIVVAREILGFEALFAALFAGDPTSAFPPAMVGRQADGAMGHPLAADFRDAADGRRLAVLKLVAALAGVPLDALVQRDAHRRQRRLLAIFALAVSIAAAISVAAALALSARAEARHEQERGVATVASLVDQRDEFGRAGRLDLLQALDRSALAFFRDRNVALLPPAAQLLSARLLHGVSEDDEAAGDLQGLDEASAAAWRTTHRLLLAEPDDHDRAMAHAQSEYWAGLAAWRRGDLRTARARFTGYGDLAERYAARAPGRADWQREAADANSNLGSFALREGNLLEAERRLRAAQARALRAGRLLPGDRTIQDRVADGYGWLADVERLNGRLASARSFREAQYRMLLAMRARDPDDAGVEASLTKSQLGLARIAALEGRWADADRLFESGSDAAIVRARRDRTNTDIARQVRAFALFRVRAWLMMPMARRPPVGRMQAVLGDCAAERGRPHNTEAGLLCTVSEARLQALSGNRATARALIAQTRCEHGYSERWRLDLCGERDRAIFAIETAAQKGHGQ